MLFSNSELARRTEEARAVIERLTSAGCRFAQMELPDSNGTIRGKIAPLANALSASGTGVSTFALAVKGGGNLCRTTPLANLSNGYPKIVAVPDLSTAVALPWKTDVAGILFDYHMNDGSPCLVDPRHVLRTAEGALLRMNYSVRVALEYELYIVEQNDALMREERFGELAAFGRDNDFYSLSRSPSFEGLAKEFIIRCEAAGIPIEAFHTEYGHGMFEYTFAPQTPLKAADDSVRAKLYLKQLCSERGLAACYMAAKFADTGDSFCGCHHNFSLVQHARNAFWDEASGALSRVARQVAAGVLETMPAFNIIHRPWVNSFRRADHMHGCPENASWAHDNHFVGLRVVHGAVPEKMTRFEHRVPGADVNPYLSIASMLHGCLHGIREARDPPPYANGEPTLEKHWAPLPHTMPKAIDLFRKSPAVAAAFDAVFVEHLACLKEDEWKDFAAAVASPEQALRKGPVTNWELTRYFNHA